MAAPIPPGVQFGRTARVTVVPLTGGVPLVINPVPSSIGGLDLTPQIGTSWVVRKTMTPEPQRAELELVNLSAVTRGALAACARSANNVAAVGPTVDGRILASTQATLEAGYAGQVPGSLISGTLSRAVSRHVVTEWRTTLGIGDSETELNLAECRQSFEPGTPAIAVLQYAAATMGLTLAAAPIPEAIGAYVLTRGWVAYARAREVIDALLAGIVPDLSQLGTIAQGVSLIGQVFDTFAGKASYTRPITWWVEDRQIYFLARGRALPTPPIVVTITGEPGTVRLLERPEPAEDGGLRIRTLLHPGIRLGRPVTVVAPSVAGAYRVDTVEHRGNNRSGECTTTARLLALF